MLNKIILTFAVLFISNNAYTVEKHKETITEKYGKVVFFVAPGYPFTPDNFGFMAQVSLIPNLQATQIIRNFTADELEIVTSGGQLFPDAFKVPKFVTEDEKWADYPMFMYFAPSGNMYKFQMPAWYGKQYHNQFWEVIQKEVRYKVGAQNRWAQEPKSYNNSNTKEEGSGSKFFSIK